MIVRISTADDGRQRPESSSVYDDWGEMAPEAREMSHDRWLVEVVDDDGTVAAVGDMSAHPVWHGPTAGSKAMSIGISLAEEFRGRGIGAQAQRQLAQELHARGIVRVEASTDIDNLAEQRSLAKAGFVMEGVLRGAQVRRDGRHDLQVWSHLAT